MLQLKGIRKTYRTGNFEQVALDGIHLNFRKNEFVAILGTSGSGKTTCLNILGGLDRYDEGDLIINQKSTKDFKDGDWDAYRNNSVGFVFQSYNLIPHLNLIDNVEMGMTLSGLNFKDKRAKTLTVLERVGLKDHMNKRPSQLSGGQMQRVAIARALANDPDIILADEPTGALDTRTSDQIMELIKEIARDKLVIMVTHNPELAEAYADRLIRFQDGCVIYDSHPYMKAPDVTLTDTLTSDLSAKTDEQIIHVVKEIVNHQDDQLIVRITKNPTLPEHADDRIIHYCNGEVTNISDSNKDNGPSNSTYELTHTSMSFLTALNLSRKNILMKVWRTALVAFASSIGIIGIALILSLSNGFQDQIDQFQVNALSEFPLIIAQTEMTLIELGQVLQMPEDDDPLLAMRFAETDGVYLIDSEEESRAHNNVFTPEFLDHLTEIDSEYLTTIGFTRLTTLNLLRQLDDGAFIRTTLGGEDTAVADVASGLAGARLSSFPEHSEEDDVSFLEQNFDLLAGAFPTSETDLVLVVDIYNRVEDSLLEEIGFDLEGLERVDFDDIIGTEFRLITNNDFYMQTEHGNFLPNQDLEAMYASEDSITLTISGVIRRPDDLTFSILGPGIAYSDALARRLIDIEMTSDIVQAQREADYHVMTFEDINETVRDALIATWGGDDLPMMIFLYPSSFEGKDAITAHINEFNANQEDDAYRIAYTDLASTVTDLTRGIMDGVTMTLIAFSAFSLIISVIMIGIITYISVIERTKEIGVLRALGARKKDISRVFNAETFIIGICSGLLAITISYGLTVPINRIVEEATELVNVANLNPLHALILILVSLSLTLLGGMIPARMAAQKDPVEALRSE
ncbi:MAG: ABC transporter ATP-binding protein/permease [Defluviitaleaceae bacterium]|nr:ABC transporter ATP-binding protein/permease [Defluviitaleaceae bacterium]